MTESERQRAIQKKLARIVPAVPAVLPTRIANLDAALGGGIPLGCITELFGPPSIGKTTLAVQMAASAQAQRLNVAWIDADRAFDPSYAASLGMAIERLTLAQPRSAEDAMEIARRLAQSGAIDLIVVDSAAALVPMLELSAEIGGGGPSLQARVLASGLRRLKTELARSGAAALFVNQLRGRGEDASGDETTAGGPALRMSASARIALREREDGSRVEFRIIKSKVAEPFSNGDLAWDEAGGFAKTP